MENTIQNIEPAKDTTAMLLQQAVEKGADITVLERLLALQREVKADCAKQAYIDNMAHFQSEIPNIPKTKKVFDRNGKEMYRYATLDDIVATIKPALVKYGFAFSVQTKQENDTITATCIATHKEGHSEQSSFTVSTTSGTNVMSQPQKIASAQTYAKRYALCNVFGILTTDEDTDTVEQIGTSGTPKNKKAEMVMKMRALGQPDKGDELVEGIQKLTKLDPKDEKNHDEILERLQILLDERNEDQSTYENN